jgi:hypothetical protein
MGLHDSLRQGGCHAIGHPIALGAVEGDAQNAAILLNLYLIAHA